MTEKSWSRRSISRWKESPRFVFLAQGATVAETRENLDEASIAARKRLFFFCLHEDMRRFV